MLFCAVLSYRIKRNDFEVNQRQMVEESYKGTNLNECTRHRTTSTKEQFTLVLCDAPYIYDLPIICAVNPSTKYFSINFDYAPARLQFAFRKHSHRMIHAETNEEQSEQSTRHKSWIECSTNHMLPIHWFGNNLITKKCSTQLEAREASWEWSGNETKIRECQTV